MSQVRTSLRSILSLIALLSPVALSTPAANAQSLLISPSSVDFGSQPVGIAGAPWTLTVNNISAAPVVLGAISLSDTTNFVESTTCGAAVSAYSNCNVTVGFSPSKIGQINGQLLVSIVGTTAPLTVALTGDGTSGTISAPNPNFGNTSINFSSQTLSTSSNAFSVNLSNSGAGTLNITSLTVSDPADFSVSSNCGAALAGYSSCQVQVVFTPSTVGQITSSVQLISNGNPQSIALQGIGAAITTSVVVAPASINFGSQPMALVGNSQTVTVNNTGSNVIALSNFQISGSNSFSIVNNACGNMLAANSTCNVPVAFTATASGVFTAQLTFSANGLPQSIPLQGTGTSSPPMLLISPNAVDFGTVVAGTTPAGWTISVNNTSASAVSLAQALGISGSSAFSFTSNCGSTIAPHTSCNVVVAFAPTASGPYGAQINLQAAGAVESQTITLVGNATPSAPVLLVAPSAVDFGTVQSGTTANAWTLSVSNPTGGTVSFGSPITVAGSREFAITSTCGPTLAAYSSCQVRVTFGPVIAGEMHGQLVVNVAGGFTQTVALTGTGVGPALTPTVSISPLVYDFGSQVLGTPTANVSFTVTNSGSTDAYFSSNVSVTGSSGFILSQNSCANPVIAGSSCTISLTFNPSVSGTATGELLLPFFGIPDPLVVGLNGTGGVPAKLVILPSTVDFAGQAIGAGSAPLSVTLANNSGAAVPFTFGTLPAAYNVITSCANSVPANSSCTLSAVFTPTVLGAEPGVLSIGENGQPAVDQVSFSGTGTGVTFPATSYDFGPYPALGTPGASAGIKMQDVGAGHPNIAGLTTTGPFQVVSMCGAMLQSSTSCVATVLFVPVTVGPATGRLVVTFIGGATQTMNLTGTGTTPVNFTFSPGTGASTPSTTVGQTISQTVTVSNLGPTTNLSLGALTSRLGGWQKVSTTCGTSIAAGASCSISLSFAPTTVGPDVASLTVTDVTNNWPYTWTIVGQGVPAITSGLEVSPTSIKFHDFDRNYPDDSLYLVPITITNPTTAMVAFSANTGDPDFVVLDEDGSCSINNLGQYQLPAGAHCFLSALYYVGTLFPRDGHESSFISFTTASGLATSVAVTGFSPYGDDLNRPTISVSTNSLVFAATPNGSASPVQNITITNSSSKANAIWVAPNWNGSPTGPAFRIATNTCNTTLAPHATCSVGVVFTPNQVGPITNFLQFEDNNAIAPITVSLLGTGYVNNGYAVPVTGSYNLEAYPGELTVSPGETGNAKFTLTPVGGFKGTVTLSCGPLPTGVTCTFTPTSLTADGSNKVLTSTLTVSAVGVHGNAQVSKAASLGMLAAISMLGMFFARRRFRIGFMPLAMSLLLAALAAGSVGCGSGFATAIAPPGTNTILVKASTVVNGSTTVDQYASFNLTIQ